MSEYATIWNDLSPTMREGLRDPENANQNTWAALWRRGLIEPDDRRQWRLSGLGEQVRKWADKEGAV